MMHLTNYDAAVSKCWERVSVSRYRITVYVQYRDTNEALLQDSVTWPGYGSGTRDRDGMRDAKPRDADPGVSKGPGPYYRFQYPGVPYSGPGAVSRPCCTASFVSRYGVYTVIRYRDNDTLIPVCWWSAFGSIIISFKQHYRTTQISLLFRDCIWIRL